jgi:hypothetical protein
VKFTYELSRQQYNRFVDDPNTTGEIDNLGRVLGVKVTDGPEKGTSWVFTGQCAGEARLYELAVRYYIVINVTKKPWYLPGFVLDWGFKKALV